MDSEKKQTILLYIAMFLTIWFALQYLVPNSEKKEEIKPQASKKIIEEYVAETQENTTNIENTIAKEIYQVKIKVGEEKPNSTGYEATFSTLGSSMHKYRLLGYYQSTTKQDRAEEIILLDNFAKNHNSLQINYLSSGDSHNILKTISLLQQNFHLVAAPKTAVITPATSQDIKQTDNELVFRAVVDGWEIIKRYTFPIGNKNKDFTIGMDLEVKNLNSNQRYLAFRVTGPSGLMPDDASRFGVINYLTARKPIPSQDKVEVETLALSSVVTKPDMAEQDNRANLAWVGIKNRFFVAILLNKDSSISNGSNRIAFPANQQLLPKNKDLIAPIKSLPTVNLPNGPTVAFAEVNIEVEPGVIKSGETYKNSFLFYGGPAEDDFLLAADPSFSNVISYSFSFMNVISQYLVKFLNLLHNLVGNYGLAIILATILIKTALHPLARKSFVSMQKFQKVAPLMKEIQKKYAHDKVKMQQEIFKMQKENGVSMKAGCLPVFLQLPIFLALYGAFSQGFSLRHASFIPGWINDLAQPDSIYNLGFNIPLLDSSQISLLPLIYCALQVIQMSLQPKPNDPQQAQQQRIMKLMPIMFAYIFYSMPAGLVLYFTVSALYGVAENWWMKNILLPKLGITSPTTANTNTNNKIGHKNTKKTKQK